MHGEVAAARERHNVQFCVTQGDASLCGKNGKDFLVHARERTTSAVDGLNHTHDAAAAVLDWRAQNGARAVASRLVM